MPAVLVWGIRVLWVGIGVLMYQGQSVQGRYDWCRCFMVGLCKLEHAMCLVNALFGSE